MRLRIQRPDGSIFVIPVPYPLSAEGWLLLPPDPGEVSMLPYPSARGEERYEDTLELKAMICGACLQSLHQRAEAAERATAEVVGELERLTSERDSWRLRVEHAEQIVKAGCSPEE